MRLFTDKIYLLVTPRAVGAKVRAVVYLDQNERAEVEVEYPEVDVAEQFAPVSAAFFIYDRRKVYLRQNEIVFSEKRNEKVVILSFGKGKERVLGRVSRRRAPFEDKV